MTIERHPEADSPRIHVQFAGREYAGKNGAKRFEINSSLTNLYDGWTVELPVGPEGLNVDILDLNAQRFFPVKLAHSDPKVDSGKPIPILQGVITRVSHRCSDGASNLVLSGYDLGKLLDSSAKTWMRLKTGVQIQQLIEKLLDPSWLAGNRKDGWGIQGITGLNRDRRIKRGTPASTGLAGVQVALAQKQVTAQVKAATDLLTRAGLGVAEVKREIGRAPFAYVPPIQVEVGETVCDIISRAAKLSRITTSQSSFVNVSADGWIQVFNPDDYKDDLPLYVLEDHLDKRNQIIKSSDLILDGEDLYSEYGCYSTTIRPPGSVPLDNQQPNAGKVQGFAAIGILGDNQKLKRKLTFADEQQFKKEYCDTRAIWRLKQSLFRELALRYTLQGHSMPGPDGKMTPIVEGNIVEVNSSRHRIKERMLIESVTKRQADAPTGTECEIVLRRRGLLGV